MLAEGRLPTGYAVKRRKLIKIDKVAGQKGAKKQRAKAA